MDIKLRRAFERYAKYKKGKIKHATGIKRANKEIKKFREKKHYERR
jgi:hypothetical protein